MQRNAIAKGGQSKLTPNQERAVIAMLEHPTIEGAAKAVGVNKTTLWRWLQDEDFHAAYMKARRESVKQAIARMQQATGEAVTVLQEIMNDKQALVFARVASAKAIIEYSIKAVELEDLEQRLSQLESILSKKQ
jgi:AcrR family transcriptional regulator